MRECPFQMETHTNNATIELHLPFTITWKMQKYRGAIQLKINSRSELISYNIKWIDEAPNFRDFEKEAFEKIKDEMRRTIYHKLEHIMLNIKLPELKI